MKRHLTQTEFEMIRDQVNELGYTYLAYGMRVENTWVNGATVFGINENPDGLLLRYVEDDIVDENGNPYIFENHYFQMYGECKPGKRLVALYVDDFYMLLPLTGKNYILVGAVDEEKARNVDVAKSKKLPTPLLLNLPKDGPRPIEEADLSFIKQSIKKYGRHTVGSIVGSIALSLLCFILVGLVYIFSVTALDDQGNLSGTTFGILTFAALFVFVAGVICSVRFFKNIYLRNALKMRYIKKVMVISVDKAVQNSPAMTGSIHFYEWVDGELKRNSCDVGIGTTFFDQRVRFGSIVYMLTKEANQGIKLIDSRIFCTIIKEDK